MGEKEFAVTHYPDIAEGLARSGQYDIVCHGHDHVVRIEQKDATRIVNPGELMGRFGASTFVLVDTDSGEIHKVQV